MSTRIEIIRAFMRYSPAIKKKWLYECYVLQHMAGYAYIAELKTA